jgi:hypothetical protein
MCRITSSVASANHDDVEMFHVKQSSLTDTERREDLIQEILHVDASYQRIQCSNSTTDFVGDEVRFTCRPQRNSSGQVFARNLHRQPVAIPRRSSDQRSAARQFSADTLHEV